MPDDDHAARAPRPARPHPDGSGARPGPVDGPGAGDLAGAVDLGIVDSLAQLSFVVQAALGKVAAGHGLSVIQLRLLGVLRDREPGMQELARHLGLDKSSMTGLVDRAERRGLVRRDPSPHDGRAVRVSLTEEGHGLARELTAEADRRILALTGALDDAQRTRLSVLASTLVRGLSTL
ncbi:MarR family winged helix-turn-helix transcriptional regulator [Streptomyces fuscigenes]|uniref:MarR family winged helix-turn-helix transcriptional regulator n=1 Tax=Streptomyces fuscigenes TaxID=1528880 RepID=UPI001F2E7341|nr:MarR family transcriptional regulator [Streptomyces fuscigenes]MCF3961123.1 MarR family transcriptional regulator [Streptomyces fuscigenes]